MTILKQPFIEKNIKGKPYITVSAKGITNGLSNIPNDGADFGPDTMLNATDPSQIGPPYTKTYGIAEAVYYQTNIRKKKILLLPGNYNLYSQIPIYDGTVIEGTAETEAYNTTSTYLNLQTDLGNNPVMPFNSSSINNIVLKNIFFNGASHTASAIIDFSIFPEGPHHNILENIITNNMENFTYDFNLDHMEDTFCNHLYINRISWQALAGSSYFFNGTVGQFTAGSEHTVINNTTIADSVILMGENVFFPALELNNVWFDHPSASIIYFGVANQIWTIAFNNCYIFLNQNNGSPPPAFALKSGISSATAYVTFNNTIISYFNQAGSTCSSLVSYPMFGTGITGNAMLYNVQHDCGGVPTFWTDWQNWLVDYEPKNVNAFSITTPAVPASGTTITNNNPFSVDIYITNAGSVSSYQINNLTISAGLSVGQKITLAPGWSLTLTYSTAPTWTWAYHV